jgi:hypothetical protein
VLRVDYALYEQVRRLIAGFDARVDDEQFAEQVTLRLALPRDRWDDCAAAVIELSNATVALEASEDW